MRNKSVTYVVQAAVIAALYVVLTLLANALGLSSYSIQVRFSEALCILPFFTPAAIPGLWIGCLDSEPDDRSYHLGYCIWKYCNIDRSGR